MSIQLHVIIPTRGDRPEFLAQATYQLSRNIAALQNIFNLEPTRHIAVSAVNETKIDLAQKIEIAIAYKEQHTPTTGFFSSISGKKSQKRTVYVIWEDDDCYPDHYLTAIALQFANNPNLVAFGYSQSLYMHLGLNKQKLISHPGRASLFQTAFTAEAVANFDWSTVYNKTSVDIELWKHFGRLKQGNNVKLIHTYQAIGIKHNIGVCAGTGHTTMQYTEPADFMLLPHYHAKFYRFIQHKIVITK